MMEVKGSVFVKAKAKEISELVQGSIKHQNAILEKAKKAFQLAQRRRELIAKQNPSAARKRKGD